MKICIITNTFSPDLIGGSNIYASVISRELGKMNYEVVVIAAGADKKDSVKIAGGIKIYYFHPFNISISSEIGKEPVLKQGLWTMMDIYNCQSYIKLLKILGKENPDIVHLHTPLDITLAAFDAARKMKLPLVFTAHDYLLLCRRVILLHKTGEICTDKNVNPLCKLYRSLSKRIIGNKADIVIFPSKFICDMFINERFFRKTKKVILPYPVNLNDSPLLKDNASVRKTGLNILYVGSLSRHKGIPVLMEAVKKIKNKNIRVSIVGSGRLKNKLEYLAKADNRITFIGKIRNDQIQDCYDKADLLVVPSVWNEVFGIVILEAFRAGVPAIASAIGGITEVVKDNYNGFLFEQGDTDQLKKIIENILENPGILVQLGNNAREYVKQYELSLHMRGLISNYEEAIKLNKARKG